MNRLLIPAAAIAAAVTLAACGGGGGGSASTATPSADGKAVSVKEIGGVGRVLVDPTGHALYASDQETAAHKVLCTGACNSFWTPAIVSGGVPSAGSVPGKLGLTKRGDGARQLTYNGKLLYSFTEDKPGKVTGDGFKDAFAGQQLTWHVVGDTGASSAGSSGGSTQSGY